MDGYIYGSDWRDIAGHEGVCTDVTSRLVVQDSVTISWGYRLPDNSYMKRVTVLGTHLTLDVFLIKHGVPG